MCVHVFAQVWTCVCVWSLDGAWVEVWVDSRTCCRNPSRGLHTGSRWSENLDMTWWVPRESFNRNCPRVLRGQQLDACPHWSP